jgi:hypothetical protein
MKRGIDERIKGEQSPRNFLAKTRSFRSIEQYALHPRNAGRTLNKVPPV